MLILVVDTAGSTGGVLLARCEATDERAGSAEVLGFRELPWREFSIRLMAAVAELAGGDPYRLADVDVLAVVSGPGSFTGLRVGLSAVKALAEPASKPIVAVSRLAVMASALQEGEIDDATPVHAVLDAGRGEFYHGVYRDGGWTRMEESLLTLHGLGEKLSRNPGVLISSDASVLVALQAFAPREIAPVGVRQAMPLAWRSWRAGRVSDVATLDANYLRASDAEILARLAVHAQQRKTPRSPEATGPIDDSALSM